MLNLLTLGILNGMGVEFTEEQQYTKAPASQGPQGLMAWVIKSGLAKDEAGAIRLLVIIAVVAVIAAVAAPFMLGGSTQKMEAPPGYRIVTPPGGIPRLQKI